MKTVLITGAGGFIASVVAPELKAKGWRVIGSARHGRVIPGFDRVFACALGESMTPHFDTESIDAVVHTANDDGRSQYELNVHGTLRWMKEAAAHSRPVQLLLSSLSAAAVPPTEYGRAKRDLEISFLASGGVVLRLGLVVGNGGLFGRMVDAVIRSRFLPLLDGGRAPVYVVDPLYLAEVVARAVSGGEDFAGRIWHLHQPTRYSLRNVMTSIRTHSHSNCRFVSIPSWLVLWPLVIAERLTPFHLPVSSTNVRGLRVTPMEVPSDFASLGGVETPLDSLVADALSAQRDAR